MGAKSKIEWTQATWTPLRARVRRDAPDIARAKGYTSLVQIAEKMVGRVGPHCEHVSPGCEHCYAETMNSRCLTYNGTGLPYDRRSRDLLDFEIDEKILLQPLHWRKPRRIFVCSQTDLFGEWVTFSDILVIHLTMLNADRHEYQVLTKRPQRAKEFYLWWDREFPGHDMPKKLDLGVSVENQPTADERIVILLQTPAARRFVSYEPALGPVDLTSISRCMDENEPSAEDIDAHNPMACHYIRHGVPGIDWVIAGGESGPGARPAHPGWFRSVRDQCVAAGVPFFFKQWGEWSPLGPMLTRDCFVCVHGCRGRITHADMMDCEQRHSPAERIVMRRVGKKAAGRLLDGREWSQFPEVRG